MAMVEIWIFMSRWVMIYDGMDYDGLNWIGL
jgi:hypothetical protein